MHLGKLDVDPSVLNNLTEIVSKKFRENQNSNVFKACISNINTDRFSDWLFS